jgi:hypothetical protein
MRVSERITMGVSTEDSLAEKHCSEDHYQTD